MHSSFAASFSLNCDNDFTQDDKIRENEYLMDEPSQACDNRTSP